MKTEDFNYRLPQALIAQFPLKNRQDSRLLVYDRQSDQIIHSLFKNLTSYLRPGDLLVINKTKVIPARLFAHKNSGGKVEVLLLKKISNQDWEVLVGGKRIVSGVELKFTEELTGLITQELDSAKRVIHFSNSIEAYFTKYGQMPLPPYIHERLDDPDRYQTVYAQYSGSAAAPTAGLHFTNEIMQELKSFGVQFTEITLHVGLDTFAPVTEEDVETHKIHTEWCEVTNSTAKTINQAKNEKRRVVAVGTTSVRTLESAAYLGEIQPICGPTGLFIYPGYQFRVVDGMITNFHLPKSSLIMLVSAFMGRENILRCYQEAISEKYRFYSFGDAMLIL
ncbi:MAG: tRNA preQ1(34) S-adenosylmethionine ribosyltransferase-isomerase QueA [Anaerolineaceae bacterium]|nr:tRNA preQ1(34) S-adenosylmethionine ribosyltransferase-isomerase QueA [Anaerolineaceae bacterium]